MFRKPFLIGVSLIASAVAYAQQVNVLTSSETVTMEDGRTAIKTTTTEYAEPMNDRAWYVRLAGGAHIYVGENEWKAPISDYVVPTGSISVGHWFGPAIAVDLNFQLQPFKGIAEMYAEIARKYDAGAGFFDVMDQNFITREQPYISSKSVDDRLYMQDGVNYFNLYGRVLFDLRTLIAGYKAKRIYYIMPFAGGGWLHGLNDDKADSPTFNAGFINQFKITDHFSIDLSAYGALVGENFDGELTKKRSMDGYFSVTAGVAVSFGKPVMPKMLHETITYDYDIDDLIAKLNAAELSLAEASKANALLVTKLKETKQVETIPIRYVVNFLINRDEVVRRERVNLETIAGYMKANPDRKFVVCGYADKQTGNDRINTPLSERRAQHTYDVLVKEFGVNPEQLSVEHYGGVDYMFYNDNTLTRCAIVADAR